jgi:hypothetical protein
MLMTNQQAAELAEPGVGSLHDPAALVASQLTSIFVPPLLVAAAVRDNQFNPTLLQPFPQRVGIVAFVGDHALGLLPRTPFPARDADFRERVFRKRNFCRRGTFQPNSQRNIESELKRAAKAIDSASDLTARYKGRPIALCVAALTKLPPQTIREITAAAQAGD